MNDKLAVNGTDCHQSIITADHLTFAYEQKKVLDGLNFSVLQRDFVGLIGSNGAGKTTLLKLLTGLLQPTGGEVRLFGQRVSEFKDWERIGYVPQKNSFNPLFPATVKEVVMSGLYGKKRMFSRIRAEDRQKCEDALYALGIEDLGDRLIGRLSGGQQQRVFLARALINNPELLILDEPMVGIDAETQANFFHMIRHMHQHHQITFLMVSHDHEMLTSYLGKEPAHTFNRLQFYVKHSHSLQDCRSTNISHTLRDFRQEQVAAR